MIKAGYVTRNNTETAAASGTESATLVNQRDGIIVFIILILLIVVLLVQGSIIDRLAEGVDVRLNHCVELIDYTAATGTQDGRIIVHTRDEHGQQ